MKKLHYAFVALLCCCLCLSGAAVRAQSVSDSNTGSNPGGYACPDPVLMGACVPGSHMGRDAHGCMNCVPDEPADCAIAELRCAPGYRLLTDKRGCPDSCTPENTPIILDKK
jgi:hypothetical protein